METHTSPSTAAKVPDGTFLLWYDAKINSMEESIIGIINLEHQIRTLPTPYVVVAVGIPGSGKTTVLKKLAGDLGVKYISPDEIRAELTGSEHNQSANAQVWKMTYHRVKSMLQKGHSVVVDATHTSNRSSTVKQYRSYGAISVVAVTFSVPLEVAKQRNAARSRTVDVAVLDKMYIAFERRPVSLDEGFNKVLHYKSSPQDFS